MLEHRQRLASIVDDDGTVPLVFDELTDGLGDITVVFQNQYS